MVGNFKSKKEVVYDLLRENIVKGVYTSGTRLVIDELSKQLGVSQIPIREAIQQLEADGFVSVEPYIGARIAEIDASFIFEVFALLENMEIICGRAACISMSDDQLETLAQMVADMDNTVDKPEEWSQQNKAMHLFICDCADTVLVGKMLQKTFHHWERLRNHYLQDMPPTRLANAQAEHRLLLRAFQNRDIDQVEAILREHNRSALKSYIQHMEAEGLLASEEN